jgi:hypothetical protein
MLERESAKPIGESVGGEPRKLYSFFLIVLLVLIAALIIMLATAFLYKFTGLGVCGKDEADVLRCGKYFDFPSIWGQMGDFIGGIINPIIGFVTVAMLIVSNRISQTELTETRAAAALAAAAQEKMELSMKRQLVEAQKQNLIANAYKHVEEFQYYWASVNTISERWEVSQRKLVDINGTNVRRLHRALFPEVVTTACEATKGKLDKSIVLKLYTIHLISSCELYIKLHRSEDSDENIAEKFISDRLVLDNQLNHPESIFEWKLGSIKEEVRTNRTRVLYDLADSALYQLKYLHELLSFDPDFDRSWEMHNILNIYGNIVETTDRFFGGVIEPSDAQNNIDKGIAKLEVAISGLDNA